jgi:hypothetical protein
MCRREKIPDLVMTIGSFYRNVQTVNSMLSPESCIDGQRSEAVCKHGIGTMKLTAVPKWCIEIILPLKISHFPIPILDAIISEFTV